MEVLLLSDISGIGKKNDLLVVKSGFALNFLLPHGKALVVTPNVRKRYAEQIKKRALEREKEREFQTSLQTALGGKTVHFEAKVSKTGKLYAAISETAIAERIKKEHSIELPTDAIVIQKPIKTTGKHTITLNVGTQSIDVTVEVQAEKETETAEKAA